jgi:membrane fusion protein (multidrug efflux system)
MFRWAVLILLFLSSCADKSASQGKGVKVKVMVVEAKTIPIDFSIVGVTQSSHLVDIWSRVEGYLDKINFVEGAYVTEGHSLFQLDASQFESSVKEAQANLDRAKATLVAAQKAYDRYKPLFEQKAASRKDLDDASSQLLAEQANVAMNQARLDQANLNLGYTNITSPISGITTSAKYREGTLINPGVNGLLTSVAVIDPIWVSINVSDQYFLKSNREVAAGELIIPEGYQFDVSLILADGTIFPEKGKVDFISPILDPGTGTLGTRAIFPNPGGALKPGQFIRAKISGAKRPNAIVIPQRCVQQGAQGRYVYVVGKNNKAEIRHVETGDWYENSWIIQSGLKPGDVVVVDGLAKLQDGTLVEVSK